MMEAGRMLPSPFHSFIYVTNFNSEFAQRSKISDGLIVKEE